MASIGTVNALVWLFGAQLHVGIHARLQMVVGIGNVNLDLHGAGGGVERIGEARDLAGEMFAGGLHVHVSRYRRSRTFAASDSGTGMRKRSTLTCATVTTGRPLVFEVPACTSEPVSEKRQVTTPS